MKYFVLSAFCLFYFNISFCQGLEWAVSSGGATSDRAYAVAVDDSGNVYTTGTFSGTADFDPGIGVANLTAVGAGNSIFIQKLDSTGAFLWVRSIGTTSLDNRPHTIKVDTFGNVYISGKFAGTNMDADPGLGVSNLNLAGIATCFVLKLNSTGDLVWAKSMQGISGDIGTAVVVDDSSNVYLGGDYYGTMDLDPGTGNVPVTSNGFWDIFIVKLDSSGAYQWGGSIGSIASDRCFDLELDSDANIYATGSFSDGADFDPGPGVHFLAGGNINMYVLKLNRNGEYVWAVGTSNALGDITAYSIALDRSGNIYTTGRIYGNVDIAPGTPVQTFNAGNKFDGYVMKLSDTGAFIWAKQLKATDITLRTAGHGVVLDTADNVYVGGRFADSLDIDPGIAQQILAAGEAVSNGFLMKMDSAGNFIWGKHLASALDSNALFGIAADKEGHIFTAGMFSSTIDFDFTTPLFALAATGQTDMFVQKLNTDSLTLSVKGIQGLTVGLHIFPNPTSESFNIISHQPIDKLMVTDVMGKKILEKDLNSKSTMLSMEHPGVYFITTFSSGARTTQKVVVTGQ